ncbi:MAG: hypothetical protein ACHQX3_08725 [Nitrospirales bacterium]
MNNCTYCKTEFYANDFDHDDREANFCPFCGEPFSPSSPPTREVINPPGPCDELRKRVTELESIHEAFKIVLRNDLLKERISQIIDAKLEELSGPESPLSHHITATVDAWLDTKDLQIPDKDDITELIDEALIDLDLGQYFVNLDHADTKHPVNDHIISLIQRLINDRKLTITCSYP